LIVNMRNKSFSWHVYLALEQLLRKCQFAKSTWTKCDVSATIGLNSIQASFQADCDRMLSFIQR